MQISTMFYCNIYLDAGRNLVHILYKPIQILKEKNQLMILIFTNKTGVFHFQLTDASHNTTGDTNIKEYL